MIPLREGGTGPLALRPEGPAREFSQLPCQLVSSAQSFGGARAPPRRQRRPAPLEGRAEPIRSVPSAPRIRLFGPSRRPGRSPPIRPAPRRTLPADPPEASPRGPCRRVVGACGTPRCRPGSVDFAHAAVPAGQDLPGRAVRRVPSPRPLDRRRLRPRRVPAATRPARGSGSACRVERRRVPPLRLRRPARAAAAGTGGLGGRYRAARSIRRPGEGGARGRALPRGRDPRLPDPAPSANGRDAGRASRRPRLRPRAGRRRRRRAGRR